jgi:hypothetical protein
MGTDLNALSRLLGVNAHDPNALRAGVADKSFQDLLAAAENPNRTVIFHDFTGPTIPPGLTLTQQGTPTAAAAYGTVLGGGAVLTTDDVAATTSEIATGLVFQVNRQVAGDPLVFEAKFRIDEKDTAEVFLGFTDAVTDGDNIALSATSTFTTSAASNAVLLGYSATPTSGAAFTSGGNQHTAISINGNTDAVVATGAGAFAEAVDYWYRIEIDSDGTARYYVNGSLLATKASAVAVNVPLCAYALITPRTTSARVLTLRSLYARGA